MNTKETILQELEQTPEPLLGEVLHYLLYLKALHEEEMEDLEDIRIIREEIRREGTIPWEDVKKDLGLVD
ncbi:hypothetical protein [Stenomitos frigidus]|uniref:DUF2281 domain-containing protein n=1 Tax=Stenomitos frigidus ULC18 TaxID=2107698 RepID=A0A2T1E010_9CYAN|nr:hypothetical protein [Stenomitos frigidus]PSB26088.1 hypothetical protein C7B82_20790 [Stenomitos frigidus ULC18]